MSQNHYATGTPYAPNGYGNDYWVPHGSPELVSPEPRRFNPEMSNQIADGIQHMDLNSGSRPQSQSYSSFSGTHEVPHLSPFPKLVNPPPNVPPSDEELEARLESARVPVLNSNDPEMQLAWAQDALMYAGVCADDAERVAALRPQVARPATPRIEHQLKTDAMNIVTFLADQQHPKAEFLRGMWLERGTFGQREDKKEAFRCYSRAADKGYARAEYRLGMLFESYNDPVKALRHYYRGVEAGDAASCYRLGMMTLRGQHGQKQDFPRAIDLIRRSAEGADENAAQGAYVYGMLLSRQLPQIDLPDGYLPVDDRLARQNIEKAAYMKFAKAQQKMGSCYELGMLGCDFHPALSVHYNALASRQGEAEADMALSKWFLVGSDGLFPKNEELAYTYAERAAQTSLPTAEFALGYFHEIGMYVHVDLDKALDWYHKAARHGNQDAKGRIEGLAKNSVLSKKDHETVAINRIKSQHGSMRGARPDRLRSKQMPQLPSVVEGQGSHVPQYPTGPAPYPTEQRPASVAPYPLDDLTSSHSTTPRLGAGPPGGFHDVQLPRPATTIGAGPRPGSAFQINPDLRNNPSPAPNPLNPRPYPAGPGLGVNIPGARPPPGQQQYDPRSRPPPQRITSGPPNMQQRPPTQQQQQPGGPQIPGKVDIGYYAPLEDARIRHGPSNTPKLTHSESMPVFNQPPGPGYGGPGPGHGPAPGRVSTPNSAPRPTPNSQRPQQQQQHPPPPSGYNSSGGFPPKVPHKDSQRPAAAATAPASSSAAGTSAAPPKPKPVGSGPKTFEEMGVPAQKKEEECIIM